MPAVTLIGFAPDRSPTEPGVMTSCVNFIPTEGGFAAAPAALAVPGPAALAAPCRGALVATKIDGTRRPLAGTQTRLYEVIAGAWTDVSRALAYTGSTDNRWSFAQFGNTTLTTNDNRVMLASGKHPPDRGGHAGPGTSDLGYVHCRLRGHLECAAASAKRGERMNA